MIIIDLDTEYRCLPPLNKKIAGRQARTQGLQIYSYTDMPQ